jgi:hypothetical protein
METLVSSVSFAYLRFPLPFAARHTENRCLSGKRNIELLEPERSTESFSCSAYWTQQMDFLQQVRKDLTLIDSVA